MPNIGDRARHDCPDCGKPMHWTDAAVRHPDLLATRAPGVEPRTAYVDAYRCANGHTSKECALCGSYDTAAWADREHGLHYHVICAACGNDSVVET